MNSMDINVIEEDAIIVSVKRSRRRWSNASFNIVACGRKYYCRYGLFVMPSGKQQEQGQEEELGTT